MATVQGDDLLGRGVWKLPYRTPEGYEILVAITSRAKRLRQIALEPGTSEERVTQWLETLLERHDPPPPPLRLVKPPPQPKPLTIEQIDALYRDADPIRAMLWRRKKEAMARKGQRIS